MIWPFKQKKKPTISVDVSQYRSDRTVSTLYDRSPILDRHFKLLEQLQNTYTPASEKAVEKSIGICQELIDISEKARAEWLRTMTAGAENRKKMGLGDGKVGDLPYHPGYKQLAIIYEKRGEFDEAIKVARQAQSQGWNGDWEKRIARCESKIAKRSAKP
jgi:tetratricopeptide (TPR) repeat protein